MTVGTVGFEFGPGEGIRGWRLADVASSRVDGLAEAPSATRASGRQPHPNGTVAVDHVVVLTPELERTTDALAAIGVEQRRVREVETDDGPMRQGFFRLGEVILELVAHPGIEAGPARFWGITFTVEDLDRCAELLGERLGSIREAVQPGRQIATLRRSACLGLPVALMSS